MITTKILSRILIRNAPEISRDRILEVTLNDIETYLSEVKTAVNNGRYRIDQNSRRQDNLDLFLNYVIDEAKAKEILLSLSVTDFSEVLRNEQKYPLKYCFK